MRNTTRILALLFVAGNVFGQQGSTNPDPLGMQGAIDWINQTRDGIYHQETESQCIGGTIHNLTYIYTFGNKGQIPLMDVDTGQPCACPTVPSGSAQPVRTSVKQHKMQEDNCDSGAPYDDSMADSEDIDGLLQLLEGSTGPDPFALPARPAVAPMGVTFAPRVPARTQAAAASSSYVFTLPYRALPAAPLLLASLPAVSPVCNSSMNPTFFETAHIDDVLKRFNSCTGALIATIPVPDLPLQVRVTPDGTQAIVTCFSGVVVFVSTATNQVTKVLQLPDWFTPSGLAISPDGRYALITNLEPAGADGAALGVIDLSTDTMTSTITLITDYPQSVFITPDATLAWVAYPFNNLVEVIDLMTGFRVKAFNLNSAGSVAFNATGTVAYVSGGFQVDVIDMKTYAIIASVATGAQPADLFVTPDGAFVVATNSGSNSVSVIDTLTLTPSTVNVSGYARGVVPVPIQ
jgi:YVTN family beta-propeller protein